MRLHIHRGNTKTKDSSNEDYVWNIAAMFAKEGKNEAYLRAYLSKLTTKKLTPADINYAVKVLQERSYIEQINRQNGYDSETVQGSYDSWLLKLKRKYLDVKVEIKAQGAAAVATVAGRVVGRYDRYKSEGTIDAELLAPGDKIIHRNGTVATIEAKRAVRGGGSAVEYKVLGQWMPEAAFGGSEEKSKPWRRYLGRSTGDALRLIHTETSGANQVKVYYNSDVEEFVAKLYVGGKYQEPADYFTNEKADAIATAKQMAAKGVISDGNMDPRRSEQVHFEYNGYLVNEKEHGFTVVHKTTSQFIGRAATVEAAKKMIDRVESGRGPRPPSSASGGPRLGEPLTKVGGPLKTKDEKISRRVVVHQDHCGDPSAHGKDAEPPFRKLVNASFNRKNLGKYRGASIRQQNGPDDKLEYFADFPGGTVAGPFKSVAELKSHVDEEADLIEKAGKRTKDADEWVEVEKADYDRLSLGSDFFGKVVIGKRGPITVPGTTHKGYFVQTRRVVNQGR